MKTKEDYIQENALLRDERDKLIVGEKATRMEFAKAFKWTTNTDAYGFWCGKTEIRTLSWEEIFVEVGKLLAGKNFRSQEDEINELGNRIRQLEMGQDKSQFATPRTI